MIKKGSRLANGSTVNTEQDPRTNNPSNKVGGIKALSSNTIQITITGTGQKRRRCWSGGRPGPLRPANLNRPGATENRRTQEHQYNQKPRTDVLELKSRDESNTLEITQPFRANRTNHVGFVKPNQYRPTM
jgi:hypothetical protein